MTGVDWLDEQWYFDPRAKRPDQGRFALVRRMREERFDLAVLLTNSFHTALLAWLGGAKERVGYARNGRGLLLTNKVATPRDMKGIIPRPMVQSYLDLAAAVGCGPESPRLELAVTPPERRLGESIWRRLGLRRDGRVVAIYAGGAYGAAKQWPVEHAAALARLIVRKLDHDALIVCGPQECQTARDIVLMAECPRVFSLASQPVGLPATKACLQRCRLLVSTDSGPRHVAAALGTQVITLLRPDVAGLDREPDGPGRCRPAGDGLHRLRKADLSPRASTAACATSRRSGCSAKWRASWNANRRRWREAEGRIRRYKDDG